MSNKTEDSQARVLVSISSGQRKGKTLLFTGHNVCVFGRASNSFEILDKMDQTIGRHHFSLEIDPPEVKLRDLQSLNGTYVNGQKIGGSDGGDAYPSSSQSTRKDGQVRQGGGARRESPPILLRHGDKIQVGSDIFDIVVEMPVPCGRCGNATDLYAAAVERQSTSRAFCSVCYKAFPSEIAVPEIAVPEIAVPEIAPDSALNGPAGEKEALIKNLEAASHDESREKDIQSKVIHLTIAL